MDEYLLPRHIYCCRRGNAYVFLDLKQDDYTLVAGPAAGALHALIDRDANATGTDFDSLRELEQGGLLTKDPNAGRPIATTEVGFAVEPLLEFEMSRPTRARLVDYWNFVAACTSAAARLRWQPLEKTVTGVLKRKARLADRYPQDIARARDLTAVFLQLRRLFPANYLCLFDSLALIEFLARYRLYPTWVFGVKLEPWGAHCWIQQDQFTFNESVEEAATYTPIMAI
jgi:hypothetical protein